MSSVKVMKRFFIYFGVFGTLTLVGVAALLLIGPPADPQEVIKTIDFRRAQSN